jgi:tripartite ATP-independent transporter DctM subunit
MTSLQIGLLGLVFLFFLIGWGVYVPVALSLVGFFGVILVSGLDAALQMIGWLPYHSLALFAFVTMPLFILMGEFAHYTGASTSAFSTSHKWLGNLTGGLAMAVTAACALFAACSGSSIAATATMSRIALPEMKKYNYDPGFATGLIAASGSLAALIPPSVILVLYAMLTEQSLVRLLLAGFIPGILSAIIYMVMIYVLVKIKPKLGSKRSNYSWKEKLHALPGLVGILIISTFVIGGMYIGVFTASEAAATGSILTLIMALLKKSINLRVLRESVNMACITTCSVFFIIFGAYVFGKFLSLSQLTAFVVRSISEASLPPIMILCGIGLVYLAMGTILEGASMLAVSLPIVFPIIVSLGYDPIWFGIIVVKMVEIAVITPPLGLNVFAVKGVVGDAVPLEEIFKNILPFLLMDILTVIILVAFPQLVLFLPSRFLGQ